MSEIPRLIFENDCLQISGDVTPESVMAIRERGEQLLVSQAKRLEKEFVVDLSGLGAAHSVVLSLLLCWLRKASENQISLRIEGVGGRLLSLASLYGLNEHLPGLDSEPGPA